MVMIIVSDKPVEFIKKAEKGWGFTTVEVVEVLKK
jgi:aldehyde:ferredoxin oxidoreductase